jgi:hypothetical protein
MPFSGRRTAAVASLSLLVLSVFLVPPAARADKLQGTVEYNYSFSETKTRTEGTETVKSDVKSFSQRYRLNFDKSIYPFLTVRGGGLFEKADSSVDTGGQETDSTLTRTNPYAEVVLGNPLYNAAAGYNRQDETQKSPGTKAKLTREVYNARLGWQPVDLPTLSVMYTRNDTYDPDRTVENSTRETVQFGSIYKPVSKVDMIYQGTWNRTEERIGGVETTETIHTGQVNYGDRFLEGRFNLQTNYSLSNRRTEIQATRGGDVTAPVQAFAGFSALDDTPAEGELNQTPGLIDGNLTASVGIDIGLPAVSDPSGTLPRNLGLDLLQSTAEVNGLRVWVDRALPADVAGSFRWTVYVSSNNLDWTLWQTASAAPFGPFDNRFEVRFPTARTRYVKVVVVPLAATVVGALGFPDIFVTELQAILTLPAAQATQGSTQTTHTANVAAKARLLDNPSLFYDFSLFYTRNEQPSSVSRTLVSNGLSLSKNLNRWLTGTALAARDDIDEPDGRQRVYRYGASLNAIPLRTLTHSLVYSGRNESVGGLTNVRNSLFLNNRATLYRGIDLFLNGGASELRKGDGENTRSYLANFGTDIRPHPTMTWSIFLATDRSERTGGTQKDVTTFTRRARASVAWNPLSAVNLFASSEVVDREEGKTTLHNWSLNWSPFQDGTLQMSFAASETLRPEENGLDRLLSPSLRWEIRKGTFLDLSYAYIRSKLLLQETDSRVVSANLQANF